jgi:hypothetical protein
MKYRIKPYLGKIYKVTERACSDDAWFLTSTENYNVIQFLKKDFIKLDMNNKLIGLLFL